MAFPEDSAHLNRFRQLAKESGLWLSLGGFHNKVVSFNSLHFCCFQVPECDKPLNSHIVIDSEGNTRSIYNKLHLFDLDLPVSTLEMASL